MDANEILSKFKFLKLLNSDQGGRRIILQGTISDEPALLLAERGAFSVDNDYLQAFPRLISDVENLGDNDIYRWYLARTWATRQQQQQPDSVEDGTPQQPQQTTTTTTTSPADLKLNLIYPSTEKHVRKYAFQAARVVVETPTIYALYVRPYMQRCRAEGRLNWVFNILEGRTEQENVLYRSSGQREPTDDDYLLLPDLNWDRTTLGALHLLALVARRDVWSVRDLRRRDAAWLRRLRDTLARTVTALYPGSGSGGDGENGEGSGGGGGIDADMLKFYVHYQPTYYHFHIHIVHVNLDPTATQAVGKALGLDHVISQLEHLEGGDEAGMHQVDLSYTLGEASELWTQVFRPLKEGREPAIAG